MLVVLADEVGKSGTLEPRTAVRALGAHRVERVQIAGREFWRGTWRSGGIHRVVYTTSEGGYVLYFSCFSYDKDVLGKFERSIQALTFFDPKSAKDRAGPDGRPYGGPPPTQ
ncbi:MAG: hypothetical protein P8Z30_04635 [Acidobacteriota bacterium]